MGELVVEAPPPSREELLEALHEAVGGPVPAFIWAGAQMCDIKKLEIMVGIARADPTYLLETMAFNARLPLYWKQKMKRTTGCMFTSGPASPQGVGRDQNTTNACKFRDGYQCVLTSMGRPDGCHIFPFCHLQIPPCQSALWKSLRLFWTDETTNNWVSSIFPTQDQEGVENCANMISMGKDAHHFWGDCLFALRPVSLSDDQRRLELEFVWLKQQNYSMVDVRIKLDPRSQGDEGPQSVFLYDGRTKRILQTGDIIIMTTDDPVARPLPSIPLLEMQWVLNQFCSMCAGAEPVDLEVGDDSDDDYFDLPARYEDISTPRRPSKTISTPSRPSNMISTS